MFSGSYVAYVVPVVSSTMGMMMLMMMMHLDARKQASTKIVRREYRTSPSAERAVVYHPVSLATERHQEHIHGMHIRKKKTNL